MALMHADYTTYVHQIGDPVAILTGRGFSPPLEKAKDMYDTFVAGFCDRRQGAIERGGTYKREMYTYIGAIEKGYSKKKVTAKEVHMKTVKRREIISWNKYSPAALQEPPSRASFRKQH